MELQTLHQEIRTYTAMCGYARILVAGLWTTTTPPVTTQTCSISCCMAGLRQICWGLTTRLSETTSYFVQIGSHSSTVSGLATQTLRVVDVSPAVYVATRLSLATRRGMAIPASSAMVVHSRVRVVACRPQATTATILQVAGLSSRVVAGPLCTQSSNMAMR